MELTIKKEKGIEAIRIKSTLREGTFFNPRAYTRAQAERFLTREEINFLPESFFKNDPVVCVRNVLYVARKAGIFSHIFRGW